MIKVPEQEAKATLNLSQPCSTKLARIEYTCLHLRKLIQEKRTGKQLQSFLFYIRNALFISIF